MARFRAWSRCYWSALLLGLAACGRGSTAPGNGPPVDPGTVDTTPRNIPQPIPADAVLVNPLDKIQRDLEAGTLTPQQAAVYGVQAMFSDPGLPASYQGDVDAARVVGNDTDKQLSWAQDLYGTFTPEQRAIVLPRLLPPAYVEWPPGMRVRSKGTVGLRAHPGDRPTYLPPEAASLQWTYIESVSSGIRVWYEVDNPETLTMAQLVRTVLMDEVIPKLDPLMDLHFLSDATVNATVKDENGNSVTWGFGGDGKLDVYMLSLGRTGMGGYTQPYPASPGAAGPCPARPSYIVMNASYSWDSNLSELRTVLAHEYMHVLQVARVRGAACSEFDPIDEGTATWAKDYVYPLIDDEHSRFQFSEDGRMSLNGTSYPSWPFFYFMTKKQGADTMRALHVAMQSQRPYDALDTVLSGGFKKQWPEYAHDEWNFMPLTDSFKQWDRYTARPGRGAPGADGHRPPIQPEFVDLAGGGFYQGNMKLDLAPLTRAQYWFDLTVDASIRSVSLSNPLYYQRDKATAKLMVKKTSSGTWEDEDWIDQAEDKELCLDVKAEKVEELIVIYTNFQHDKADASVKAQASLKATTMGCYEYAGAVHQKVSVRTSSTTSDLTVDATVTFREGGRNADHKFKGQFPVQPSTATFFYVGTVSGCTGSKAGTVTFPATSGGTLGLYPYNAGTPNAGMYSFGLYSPDIVKVEHTCPGNAPPIIVPLSIIMNAAKVPPPQVSATGVIKDSMAPTDGYTLSWDLKPRGEP